MGFTKLDSGIVDSSIWSEPLSTRILWITLLAKSDENGFVACSKPGLCRAANISEEDFKEALNTLESPDTNSRSTEFEGRRIEHVEGGWIILNYLKYRQFSYSNNPDAIRKRKKRKEKTDTSGHCPDTSGHVRTLPGHSASSSVSSSLSLSDKKEEDSRLEAKTWRNDFQIYLKYCEDAFDALMEDLEWIKERKSFHPALNVRQTVVKLWKDYWSTEKGWKQKKASRAKEVDWVATINNGLSQKWNQVWIPKGEPDPDLEFIRARENRIKCKKEQERKASLDAEMERIVQEQMKTGVQTEIPMILTTTTP
jgi:hypothetical protein